MKTLFSVSLVAFLTVALTVVERGSAEAEMGAQAPPSAVQSTIHVLTIHGVINPLSSRYLKRELARVQAMHAELAVVRLNTPGGLDRSMREMVEMVLNAPLPVVVFVAPSGARAASAGMFLTIAAHVAAMSPGTNIGAAHPVSIGGAQQQDEVMKGKVVNDAAALARAIAHTKGRNAHWAEEAVKESSSITADEALEMKVIDIIAPDLEALLKALDQRTVKLANGATAKLRTADAKVTEWPMTLPEKILETLIDPNIAYLLLAIGFVGIIAELYNPGMALPGLVGVISLLLAFVGLGNLPFSWAGVAFIALAIVLWILELHTAGIGALLIAGIVAFVLGSLILYSPLTPVSPSLPRVRVNAWVIAAVTLFASGFFAIVARAIFIVRRKPRLASDELLLGAQGVVLSPLAPSGTVLVNNETWTAVADDETGLIPAGASIEVSGVEGVTLKVHKVTRAIDNAKGPEMEM